MVSAALIAGLTAAILEWPPPGSGAWLDNLLIPALIGSMLVGGVHGSGPGWLLLAAMSVTNGAIWAAAVTIPVWFVAEARRVRSL